jgi:hypothetical protein
MFICLAENVTAAERKIKPSVACLGHRKVGIALGAA